MEKETKLLYYIGIEDEKRPAKLSGRQRKQPLAIYRHTELFPLEKGSVCLYCSRLPFLMEEEMGRRRRRKQWMRRLFEAQAYAEEKLGVRIPEGMVLSDELCKLIDRQEDLPLSVFALGLKRFAEKTSFANISISLPRECGPGAAENMVELLSPFLSRINYVTFVGKESETAGRVEDYLYGEYGIVMSYGNRPGKNQVWIDLGEPRTPAMEKFLSDNEIYHLSRGEMLKFLDTAAKNEYNTKIN